MISGGLILQGVFKMAVQLTSPVYYYIYDRSLWNGTNMRKTLIINWVIVQIYYNVSNERYNSWYVDI